MLTNLKIAQIAKQFVVCMDVSVFKSCLEVPTITVRPE